MPIRSQDWYDLNESRPYPLSDEATGVDDDGARLPNRMIADLHLSFPKLAGQRAMISSVTITKNLVTVTILATGSPSDASSFVPIAAVSLVKPIDAHRQYPVEALFPGTGGWITFGSSAADNSDTAESYFGKFTLPSQSILLPSTTKSYDPLPIPEMSRLYNTTQLTGLVRLLGGTDVEVVAGCREIPLAPPPVGQPACDVLLPQTRDVIIIRLKDSAGIAEQNVFDTYKGLCGGRPESRSCGDPEPIELLAGVPPDCNGNISIRMRGCAVLSEVTEEVWTNKPGGALTKETCGVIIDCGLGLVDACVTPDRLPDAQGNLPNEYDDLCTSVVSITVSDVVAPPAVEESFSVSPSHEDDGQNVTLPFCDDFLFNDFAWVVQSGGANYYLVDGVRLWSTEGTGLALRNVTTRTVNYNTFYKQASARVQMVTGFSGQLHNAGVVANYRETAIGSGVFKYFIAEIDWDGYSHGYKLFRIAKFTGTSFNTEFAVPVNGLQLGHKYDILFTVYANEDDADGAWLQAQLIGVDDPSINVTIGPLAISNYTPETGQFGVGSTRSATRFYQFCVRNTADL